MGSLIRLFLAVAALAAVLASPGPVGARKPLTGVFNATCAFSHTLSDDPLVFPRTPGASHVHDFFGNRLTDAFSTGKSLLDAGRANHEITTCDDAADFAGYWTPALYRDGRKLDPKDVLVYYRNAKPDDVTPFLVGFGMIAGDPHAMEPNPHVRWECSEPPTNESNEDVPTCPNGELLAVVKFPKCWNGVDLFLPDQSHVRYGSCGGAYPVRIAELTLIVTYPNDGRDHDYRLASGSPMTLHADFFDAWAPNVLQLLFAKCLNEIDQDGNRKSCFHGDPDQIDCGDFLDNDSDGRRDFPEDPGCSSRTDNSEWTGSGTAPQCSNGLDDDGDGRRDFPVDRGCVSYHDDGERDVVMPKCSDGRDNDHDGRIDYPRDPGCRDRPDNQES